MNTQVSCLPMAFAHSAATTEESTPPDNPRITRSPPTCARMAATASSMMESIVQLASRPQMPNRKLRKSSSPCGVWRTSGWNCVAYKRRSAHSIDATGHVAVEAVTAKPAGTSATASRWLIHTVCSTGVSPYSADAPSSRRVKEAAPYSPASVWPTVPPSVTAMICCP